jgi:hypothetical protein
VILTATRGRYWGGGAKFLDKFGSNHANVICANRCQEPLAEDSKVLLSPIGTVVSDTDRVAEKSERKASRLIRTRVVNQGLEGYRCGRRSDCY